MTKTDVYRHFDESGRILYVGMSLNPIARLNDHRRDSAWFPEIRTVTIEKFNSFDEAARAEIAAIRAEKPLHNVQHTRSGKAKPALPRPSSGRVYVITDSELSRRVYAFLAEYDRYEYAWCSWDKWKRSNPALIRYLAATPMDDIKPMSEQSYRNWKAKGFAGYQIPNDDEVIEVNKDE